MSLNLLLKVMELFILVSLQEESTDVTRGRNVPDHWEEKKKGKKTRGGGKAGERKR